MLNKAKISPSQTRLDLPLAVGRGMTSPSILSIGTGVPDKVFTQARSLELFQPVFSSPRHVRAVIRSSKVETRNLAVDETFYAEEKTTQVRNESYLAYAMPLGAATIERCLQAAGVGPELVDDFFVVSCTGFDIPGLDLRLAGRLGMRADLRRTCILGMGCYGATPGLWRAHEAVTARPGRIALVLALELCSMHFQFEDTIDNMISTALFADGAAAALVGFREEGGPGSETHYPMMVDAMTHCEYNTFEHMAFHVTDHGFKMVLSSYVPELLAADIESFVDGLLGRNGLVRDDIRFWCIHPGGSKILDYLQSRLKLGDEDLRFSRAVLRDHGNMSSPTIMFVVDEIQRTGEPAEGDYGVMLTFGPGLTMESILVQW